MKKIFIPVISLLILGAAQPCHSRWGDNFNNYRNTSGSIFSSDSDGYWLNRFRGYKKYPVRFYSEDMLNANRPEDEVKTVSVHEYKRNVPVTARLNQRMYDSSTYTVTKSVGGEQYRLLRDGHIYSGQNDFRLLRGTVFTPIGEVRINGSYYMIIPLNRFYVAMVDSNGRFLDAVGQLEHGDVFIPKDITIIHPYDLRIEPYTATNEKVSNEQFHFQIKYGGLKQGAMRFLITSMNNDKEVREQFVPINEKYIEVGGVNFEIIYAGPDYIEYVILDTEQPIPEENTNANIEALPVETVAQEIPYNYYPQAETTVSSQGYVQQQTVPTGYPSNTGVISYETIPVGYQQNYGTANYQQQNYAVPVQTYTAPQAVPAAYPPVREQITYETVPVGNYSQQQGYLPQQ